MDGLVADRQIQLRRRGRHLSKRNYCNILAAHRTRLIRQRNKTGRSGLPMPLPPNSRTHAMLPQRSSQGIFVAVGMVLFAFLGTGTHPRPAWGPPLCHLRLGCPRAAFSAAPMIDMGFNLVAYLAGKCAVTIQVKTQLSRLQAGRKRRASSSHCLVRLRAMIDARQGNRSKLIGAWCSAVRVHRFLGKETTHGSFALRI